MMPQHKASKRWQKRHPEAAAVPHEFGVTGFERSDVVGQGQNFQRRAVQRRHAVAAELVSA